MDTRVFAVYNLTRGVPLNSKVMVSDSANQPLKLLSMLVSGLGLDSQSGLWLAPLCAVPGLPRVFPFDLLYLDRDYRVLETVEVSPGVEFPPYCIDVASALVLPPNTLQSSGTSRTDRLIICDEHQMKGLLAASVSSSSTTVSGREIPETAGFLTTAPGNELAQPVVLSAVPAPPLASAVAVAEALAEKPAVAPILFEQSILNTVEDTVASPPSRAPSNSGSPVDVTAAPEPSTNRARSKVASAPVPSITEAVLPRPLSARSDIVEHYGGIEDLFSNWVVTPSVAPPWIAENGNEHSEQPETAAHASTASAPPAQTVPPEDVSPPAAKPAGRRDPAPIPAGEVFADALASPPQRGVDSSQAEASKTDLVSKAEPTSQMPGVPSSPAPRTPPPARIATPQPSTSTTFTTAPFGMWQASVPTGVVPLVNAKPSQIPAALPQAVNSAAVPSETSVTERIGNGKTPESSLAKPTSSFALPLATSGRPAKAPGGVDDRQNGPGESAAKQQTNAAASTSLKPRVAKPSVPEAKIAGESTPPETQADAPGIEAVLEEPAGTQPATPSSDAVPSRTESNGHSASTLASERSLPIPAPRFPKLQPKSRTDAPIKRVETNGKTNHPPGSLRSRFLQWLNPVNPPSDRRRAYRRYVPGMVAHYYTGGAPKPYDVADISMSGFYLLTEDHWMAGTMIQMTLQKPCAKGERKQSINVLSRIVRRGSDGVAAEFVMPESLDAQSHDVQPSQTTDRFSLARFL